MTAAAAPAEQGFDIQAWRWRSGAPSEAISATASVASPRVLFAALQEPENHLSFSGAFRCMVGALRRAGFVVEVPGHALPWSVRLKRVLPVGRFHAPITRAPQEIAEAVAAASQASGAQAVRGSTHVQRGHVDVVFAPMASELIPLLPTHLPVVYFTDATPRLLRGGYVSSDRTSEGDQERWDEVERRALARADRVVYASRWAAGSGVADYGVSPSTVSVAPFGSPLEVPRVKALSRRLGSPLRLLWIGADWERKGGARALEVLSALRRAGLDVELHMCGGGAAHVAGAPGVVHHGFLDRRRWRHRRTTARLFAQSHVFLLPTRADCSPLVLAEAAAWGLPAVATRVGGVPEILEDGRSGVLVEPDAPAAHIAEAIGSIIASSDQYGRFVHEARATWERRLTWSNWAERMRRVILEAGKGPLRDVAMVGDGPPFEPPDDVRVR